MDSFSNNSIFIKRAEEYQTKDFIKSMFETNIGKVKDITFIKKQNINGSYNGVIVVFERWYSNNFVNQLIDEMSKSSDGTTKFYFNQHRYWFINIHKQLPECQEKTIVDSSLSDKEKITKLEEIVSSMLSQIRIMENQLRQNECQIMELENKTTRCHLVNVELKAQLIEKDMVKDDIVNELNSEINKLKIDNEKMKQNQLLYKRGFDAICKQMNIYH